MHILKKKSVNWLALILSLFLVFSFIGEYHVHATGSQDEIIENNQESNKLTSENDNNETNENNLAKGVLINNDDQNLSGVNEKIAEIEMRISQLTTADELDSYSSRQDEVYQEMMEITDQIEELTEEEQALINQELKSKLDTLYDWYAQQVQPQATVPHVANGGMSNSEAINLVGPYQFNIAGNSNAKGKYQGKDNYATPSHADTAAEEKCKKNLPAYTGGKNEAATNSNSSQSVLKNPDPKNNSIKIARAYLVVTTTTYASDVTNGTTQLSQRGVFLKGPKGDIQHYIPTKVYYDDTPKTRCSAYWDVTDFVQQQGYGTYTGINIPFRNMSAITSSSTWSFGSDFFGAWKLIVVEENATLPLRMVCLKLGGTEVKQGTPTNVTIQGDGLIVKGSDAQLPTGELLFSMDGYDMDSGNVQTLQYSTNKNTEKVKISELPYRSADHFYTGQIQLKGENLNKRSDVNGTSIDNNPLWSKSYTAGAMTNFTVSGVNGNQNFNTSNTDFEVMNINDSNNTGSMKLYGGETSVEMQADTSSAPTLLSALGMAVDIVVPEFKSSITITNLNQHYTTDDTGYDRKVNYALPGDRLKVTARCDNVSNWNDKIGIQKAVLTIEAPALLNIDESTISAYYEKDGQRTKLTHISVDGNTVTFSLDEGTTVSSGGHFIVSYEGEAVSTRTYKEYTNRVSVDGIFVDESGTVHHNFPLSNMGIAYAETASDILKYNLTVTSSGKGSVTGTGRYAYDASATATWKPGSDSYTRLLLVDGVVRDDLLDDSEVTIPMESKNHTVFAGFAEGTRPVQDYYTISTSGDGYVTELTPSKMLAAGEDHTVSWKVEDRYSVSEIRIDGYAYPVSDEGSITFKGILSDHTVEIHTVNNYAYIQTVVRGPGTITPSAQVRKGDNYEVNWEGKNENCILSTVTVNGEIIYNEITKGKAGLKNYKFTNVQSDQIIEVVYREEGKTENNLRLITTQMVNGPGTITPSQTIENNGSLEVNWQPEKGYEVSKVIIYRGSIWEEIEVKDNKVSLEHVTEDCMVRVFLKEKNGNPDEVEKLYGIATSLIGGPGSITSNQIDIHKDEKRTIKWEAGEGQHVVSVIVDGVMRDDLLNAGQYTFENIDQDHYIIVKVADNSIVKEDSDFYHVETHSTGNGKISDSGIVKKGGNYVVTWTPAKGEDVMSVIVDGVERSDLLDKGQVEFADIQQNHTVEVVFSSDKEKPNPDEHKYYISTEIYGGVGNITASGAVKEDADYSVSWKVDEEYYVKTVIVDGVVIGATGDNQTWDFNEIKENHHVTVILDKKKENTKPDKPVSNLFGISTEIQGPGTITENTVLNRGDSQTVEWKPANGWEVDKVYVDGVLIPAEKIDGTSIRFDSLNESHDVKVILKPTETPPTDPNDPPIIPGNIEDYKHKIETSITGGISTITPTTYYPEGKDAEVLWDVDSNYEISRIYVDGKLRNDVMKDGKIVFANLSEGHKVEVILMPLHPDNTSMEKTAKNLTHPNGPNKVGDSILYTLKATNHTPHSQWDNVTLKDQLPASLTIDLNSIKLIGPDGKEQKVTKDNVIYDEQTRVLSVNAGTLLADESYTVTFKAEINDKAVSASGGISIKNIGGVSGTDADNKPLPDSWSDEVVPGDDVVIPLDPESYCTKYAKRINGATETLYVGDRILYTLETGNKKDGSLWADVMIQDQLPEGLTPDLNTLKLILPNGNWIVPEDYTYDEKERTITVYLGDIYGLDVYKVEFEAKINEKAIHSSIGNKMAAIGYPPENRPDEKPTSDKWQSDKGAIVEEVTDPVYPEGFDKNSHIENVDEKGKVNIRTGDDSQIWIWIVICAVAIGTIVLLLKRKKEEK